MPVEFDDQALKIIGANVKALQFFDADRTLQAEIFLDADNVLNIGNFQVSGGGSGSGSALDLSEVGFLSIAGTSLLTQERVLTMGSGLAATDGGGGGAYTVGVNLAATSGLSFASSRLQIDDALAGAGLTIASKVLAVGAGTLISVAADAVGITPGAADYGYIGSTTTPWTATWRSLSTLAGAGLTHTAGVLALTTPGTLTVSSSNAASGNHTHAITSSSNPGAAASLLATDASGFLTLVKLSTDTLTDKSGGNLTISPTGDVVFDPAGNDLLPNVNYDLNLGALAKKYRTLHAAELWVETLVAQNTIATIGGRILVGPTTVLTADLAPADTTITVKHNQMVNGDRVYMEANGSVEFMAITGAAGGGAGAYTYTVTRNLDGSGANQWYAGDAMFNTGTTGKGFIDLYSTSGVKSGTGPTIVGNVRNSSTYNDWTEHWAIGNLNGLYGYGADTYGVGVGKYSTATSYLTADATNGIRIMRGTATLGQWDVSGNMAIGRSDASNGNVYIPAAGTGIQFRFGTTTASEFLSYTNGGRLAFGAGSTALSGASTASSGSWLLEAAVAAATPVTGSITAVNSGSGNAQIVMTVLNSLGQSVTVDGYAGANAAATYLNLTTTGVLAVTTGSAGMTLSAGLAIGSGGLVIGADTNLYRYSADILKTDDRLISALAVQAGHTQGYIEMTAGSGTTSGFLQIYKSDSTTRLLYIGYDNTNATYVAENGAHHSFSGDVRGSAVGTFSTATSGLLNFGNYESLGAGITADKAVFMATLHRSIYLTTWRQAFYVATTNDGSNYWTFSLITVSGTTIATRNTSAYAVNTWHNVSTNVNATYTEATHKAVYLFAAKTGAPGALFLAAPAVYFTVT